MNYLPTLLLISIGMFYMKYPAMLYHIFTLLFLYPKELLFVYILFKNRVKMQKVIQWVCDCKSPKSPKASKPSKSRLNRQT